MPQPDPSLLVRFCTDIMPHLLIEACQVDPDLAARIGADTLARAEAVATMTVADQDILIAPFVEEVFDHQPADAPLDLLATVTVVVRNSLLEQAHHDGPLTSGLIEITRLAAGPLSHFLAARRRTPATTPDPNPFTDLPDQYPRAWACLRALADACAADGGRHPLRLPDAPVPELPTADETVATTWSTEDQHVTVFSAIDERFDRSLVESLRHATQTGTVLHTSALSRYSRNSAKLHRILEYVLAHRGTILTTNYLIRPTDVWVRRGQFVKPDSRHPLTGLADLHGLAGTHRKIAEDLYRGVRHAPPPDA